MAIPDRLDEEITAFLDYLTLERGCSPHTAAAYGHDLRRCAATLREWGCRSFQEVDRWTIARYVQSMVRQRQAPATFNRHVYALRSFFRYLLEEGQIPENPTDLLDPMKREETLPTVLTVEEVERLLAVYSGSGPLALRNRAMLELLYATGLRVSELVGLRVEDVHFDLGYLRCLGKGRKQRLVPVGEWALAAVRRWLEEGRPRWVGPSAADSAGVLFLTRNGTPVSRNYVWRMVQEAARKAAIHTPVTPHTLRHTFATHLLERGMDLRYLQEMLGHARVTTTQRYTRIETGHLRAALERFHPRG